LVGQLTASSGTVGTSIRPDGRVFFCADGNYSAHLNRKSSDGAIAHFAKDDTIVGSIGTISGQPYFTGATAGGFQISHLNSTNAVIVPVTAAGANSDATHDIGYTGKRFRNIMLSGDVTAAKIISPSNLHFNQNGNSADRSINFTGTTFKPFDSSDNTLDLGTSGARWKDLYLSGGAYVGGTAAANKLDDYEEGIWTVSLTDSGGGATYTLNSAYNQLAYTKIGRQVHIQGTLVVSGVSGTANGTIQISNLPFTSANLQDQSGKSGGCGVSIYQVQKYSSGAFPATSLAEGSTTLQVVLGVVDANTYACYANTATQLYFDFTYAAA